MSIISPLKALKYKVVVKLLTEEEYLGKRAPNSKILLAEEAEGRYLRASMTGEVVDIGEECVCAGLKIGDLVFFPSYTGADKKIGVDRYRVMNDTDILAIINKEFVEDQV